MAAGVPKKSRRHHFHIFISAIFMVRCALGQRTLQKLNLFAVISLHAAPF